MKKIIGIIMLLFFWSFVWAQQENGKQKQAVIYTCVMHPEVQMTQPGNCPKCGMKLVMKKMKAPATQSRQGKIPTPKDTDRSMPMNMGNKDTMQMPVKAYDLYLSHASRNSCYQTGQLP
jgi:DNA-directed RNA polymerase subunit RPC12/RpoP